MLSARNKFKGKIREIKKEDIIGEVSVDLTHPIKINCIITREAAEELKLKIGDEVAVIIKATEVMIENIV